MKILTVLGNRPQFIKASVVSKRLRSLSGVREVLVHTGQHYDRGMSSVFFKELGLPKPDYRLSAASGSHGEQTGRMLGALDRVIQKEKPDWVLVYGDTNSTLAGALSASKLKVPVAHVESGLRSFNRRMPEEINRVMTDHLASVHFAPTKEAILNLKKEGIAGRSVLRVGDVMFDVALFYSKKSDAKSDILGRLRLAKRDYVLATIHRAENTDGAKRLRAIFAAFEKVSGRMPVLFPMHPRTQKAMKSFRISTGSVRVIEPVGYLDMVQLERHAAVIVTDSGGVQKEAFFHGIPCVTARHETEWVELVCSGWNVLASPEDASALAKKTIDSIGRKGKLADFYGDGKASQRIADFFAGIKGR